MLENLAPSTITRREEKNQADQVRPYCSSVQVNTYVAGKQQISF